MMPSRYEFQIRAFKRIKINVAAGYLILAMSLPIKEGHWHRILKGNSIDSVQQREVSDPLLLRQPGGETGMHLLTGRQPLQLLPLETILLDDPPVSR